MREPRAKDKRTEAEAVAALLEAMRRRRVGRVWSTARALLILVGPSKAIERIRRAGVLRASTFGFDTFAVGPLLTDWIAHAAEYGVNPALNHHVLFSA
jgi:hypothetical protein